MLNKRHIFRAILAATLSIGAGASAFAVPQSHFVMQAQSSISPAQAKSIAQSRVKGGQAVDIKRSGDTYRVRVIAPNNKIVDVYIDANTGRVTKVK
jgi:uncharacterized membrane protein YkoI